MVVSCASYTSCYLDETTCGSECQQLGASDFDDFKQTVVQVPKAKASSTELEVEDDAAVPKTWNTLFQIAVSYHQMMSYLHVPCKNLQNFSQAHVLWNT